jgi:hypothetical protein
MFTSASHANPTVLEFVNKTDKYHEIHTVRGKMVLFKGFSYRKSTKSFESMFRASDAPVYDSSYDYSIKFIPNGDNATWTVKILGEDIHETPYRVTSFKDVVNTVSIYCD